MSAAENPPAFPRDERYHGHNGMTLRDWFAGQALTSIGKFAIEDYEGDLVEQAETTALWSYAVADAMLAERNKQSTPQPDTDGWITHKPGDPMPCDANARIDVLLRNGEQNSNLADWYMWDWEGSSAILAWRLAQ